MENLPAVVPQLSNTIKELAVLSREQYRDLLPGECGRRFYESFSDYVRRVPRAPQ